MTPAALAVALARRVARDPDLRLVRDTARRLGAETWLVGGYVRDTALGLRPLDIDLVGGRGAAALVAALAAAWETRAFRFRKRGVTTWRIARGARRVDVVDASRRGLTADLRRRDLTINAVAFDLDHGRIVDPLHGLRDLAARRLRLPRARAIAEDAVRALRVARLLAHLPDFRALPATRRAARAARRALGRAAVERIHEELDKLLGARAPRRGLAALVELDLLAALLPELLPMRTCRAGAGRPDVWTHTLDAVALAARAARLPGARLARAAEAQHVLRWALLLHDMAKPETLDHDPTGRPTFHGHEVLGAQRVETLLRRLRAPLEDRRRIGALVLMHLRPGHLAEANAPERGLRRLARDAGDDLPLLVVHAACDARASGSPDAAVRWRKLRAVLLRLLELHEEARRAPLVPLVGGGELMRELGLAPGPRIGELLRSIREQQELGLLHTRAEALAHARALL